MSSVDGWVCSNRVGRLGCQFGVRWVASFSVLRARYMCLLIEILISIRYYIRIFLDWGKVIRLLFIIICLFWVLLFVGICWHRV